MAQFKVQAWAEIDGHRWPLSRAEVSYTLNAIPQAAVAIPLGRDLATGKPSPAHRGLDQLTYHVPVTVIAQVSPVSAEAQALAAELGLTAAAEPIFEGSIAGVTYTRTRSGARLVLALNGWLEQLTWSSVVNGGSHPGNPTFFTAGSTSKMSGETGEAPRFSLDGLAGGIVDAKTVTTDLWSAALKPWLLAICDQSTVLWEVRNQGAIPNDLAIAALRRMHSPVPLALELGLASAQLSPIIAADFAYGLGNLDAVCRATTWDFLVGRCAAQYAFAVVPRIRDALVVPFIPGLSAGGRAHATIRSRHYDTITFHGQNPTPLRGLGLIVPTNSTANADLGSGDAATPPGQQGIGPIYVADPAARGAIALEYAPSWACSTTTPVNFAVYTAGIDGQAVGTALSPGVGVTPPSATIDDRAKQTGAAAKVLVALARTRYAQRMLQGRQVVLSGAYRLDIAPGTLVEIEGAAERHLGPADAAAASFYGQVLRTSLVLDAETPGAQASFTIGHLRTAYENAQPQTSVDRHPLYANFFVGAPLTGDAAGSDNFLSGDGPGGIFQPE